MGKTSQSYSVKNNLRILLIAILIVVLIILGFYWSQFGIYLSPDQSDWSSFGTFFNGIIGPFLYFCSILVLAYTLIKQIQLKEEEKYSDRKRFLLDLIYQNASFRSGIIQGAKIDGKTINDDLEEIINSINNLDEEEFPEEDSNLRIFVHQISMRIKLTKYIPALTSLVSVIKHVVNSDLSKEDKSILLNTITGLVSNDERIIIVIIYAFNLEDLLAEENEKYLRIKELHIMKHSNAYTTDSSGNEGGLIPNYIVRRFSDKYFPLIPISRIRE